MNEKDEAPEMLELEAASDGKWGWITFIILILCITIYNIFKLYFEHIS